MTQSKTRRYLVFAGRGNGTGLNMETRLLRALTGFYRRTGSLPLHVVVNPDERGEAQKALGGLTAAGLLAASAGLEEADGEPVPALDEDQAAEIAGQAHKLQLSTSKGCLVPEVWLASN